MFTFFAAILLLLITPGPGVLSTAGVGSAFGSKAGYSYMTGLCIGSNLVMLAVVTGLAALVFGVPGIREVLLIASALYLVYLAGRIALSGSKIAFIEAQSPPGIWNGITLQFINPKAYVVGTTLFSGFTFMPEAPLLQTLLKFLIINAVWIPVHIGWLMAGVSLRRLNLSHSWQRAINIGMALAMLCVVGLAVRPLL